MAAKTEIAYAKINLALHVRRRRDDGYHEIESLVAFLHDGDLIEIDDAETDSLAVEGEFAGSVGNMKDNLVMRALHWARAHYNPDIPPIAIRLEKRLPVAAGLGGGSADAAALLRLLASQGLFNHSLTDLKSRTATLGADVPACVVSRPLIMRGIGEKVAEVTDGSLANIFAVLVNPRIPVPTGPVFKSWSQIDKGKLSEGTALDIALAGRNDLQGPAIALCPVIGDVIAMFENTQPIIARMSGSGATCFALYDNIVIARQAAEFIASRKPDWWVKAGGLTS